MTKLSEQEKTVIADRVMKELERELLDFQWLTDQEEHTFGAAQAHYKAEVKKSSKRIDSMKAELRTLGRLN
jgi:hypothetical protein